MGSPVAAAMVHRVRRVRWRWHSSTRRRGEGIRDSRTVRRSPDRGAFLMSRRLIDTVVRRPRLPDDPIARGEWLVGNEWLVTNGIGGYASSSVSGSNTRRYHGMLVAALPNPLGRMVMLS